MSSRLFSLSQTKRRLSCKIKNIIHFLSTLTYLLIGIYFFVWAPSLFRIRPLTVQSDSMSPTFSKGDLIYTRLLDADFRGSLGIGTVITFEHETPENTKVLVSHRINRIGPDSMFETKGDNTIESDKNKVGTEDVIGIVLPFSIPLLGYFIDFVNVHHLALSILALLIILFEFFVRNNIFPFSRQRTTVCPKKPTDPVVAKSFAGNTNKPEKTLSIKPLGQKPSANRD